MNIRVNIRLAGLYEWQGKRWRLERVHYGIGQVYLRNVEDEKNNAAVAISKFHAEATLVEPKP